MTLEREPFGEFSFTATSFTVLTGPLGALQMQANFEGRCSGLGFTLGTMSLSRLGASLGEWTCCTVSFLEDGAMLTGKAQGKVRSINPARWRTPGLLRLSDDRQFSVDGEVELERRSWCGHLEPRS